MTARSDGPPDHGTHRDARRRATPRSSARTLPGLLLALLVAWPAHGAEPEGTAAPGPAAPTLALALDRSAARNGDTVTATVTLSNPGPEPIELRCAQPIEAWVDITNVVEGPRAAWAVSDPWRRGMRKMLLGDPSVGEGPLAVPLNPAERARACPTPSIELASGESLTTDFHWTVGYGDGSPLYGPDAAPVIVRARAAPLGTGDQVDATEPTTAPLTAAMPISVTSARTRQTLPPAWAIESLFEDADAARWLDLEHVSSWRRAGMRLSRGRWLFDIRRIATGCCRESMTAAIDAVTGARLNLEAQTLDWAPARVRTTMFEMLELRLELQHRRFRDGRTNRIRMTVTNTSPDSPVWFWSHDNDCTLQPSISIAAGPELDGASWPGKLGVFKRMALRGEVIVAKAGAPSLHQCREPDPIKLKHGRSVTMESFFRPSTVPMGQRTLQAVGRIDLVGPRPDTVRAWRVYASPTVRARFRTGDGSQQVLSPSMLIDAALGHAEFADRIKATPVGRWRSAGVTGTSVWLELTDGTRIVGLP